jgi:serine/threonine protein kinase
MSLVAGTLLGPYEIQSVIGEGGMGQVYKARDTRLDRSVAINVLPLEIEFGAPLSMESNRRNGASLARDELYRRISQDVRAQIELLAGGA